MPGYREGTFLEGPLLPLIFRVERLSKQKNEFVFKIEAQI